MNYGADDVAGRWGGAIVYVSPHFDPDEIRFIGAWRKPRRIVVGARAGRSAGLTKRITRIAALHSREAEE